MSGDGELTERARELIRSSIRSIEELETLLWLRSEVSRRWTAAQLARELHFSEQLVGTALQGLVRCQLVVQEEDTSPLRYQYRPSSAQAAVSVDELADAYERRSVEVLTLISSSAIARLRREVARLFFERPSGKNEES